MSFFGISGLRTTRDHQRYWKERVIDWNENYLATWNHPHRFILSRVLASFPWISLIEIGCGGGANIANIVKTLPPKQLGGIDINKDAIQTAEQSFNGGVFRVGSADNIMMSDKSTDVVLSDMTLIYVSPRDIHRYLDEIKRIARNHVVLCEFHSRLWWRRLILRARTGYNAYNWKRLLSKHGFYDITEYKLTAEDWPGGNPQKEYGFIFKARVPKR